MQVDSCEFYIGKEYWTDPLSPNYTISHLHIFTVSKFEAFLDYLIADENYWQRLFPQEAIAAQLSD